MSDTTMYTQLDDGTIVPMSKQEEIDMFNGFRTIFGRTDRYEDDMDDVPADVAASNNNAQQQPQQQQGWQPFVRQPQQVDSVIFRSDFYGRGVKQSPEPDSDRVIYVNKKYYNNTQMNGSTYTGGFACNTGSYGTMWNVQYSYMKYGRKPFGSVMYTSDHKRRVNAIYNEMHIKAYERAMNMYGYYNGYIPVDIKKAATDKLEALEEEARLRAIDFTKSISRMCREYLGEEVDEEELSRLYDDEEIPYPEEIVKKWELFRDTEVELTRIFPKVNYGASSHTMTVEEFDNANIQKIYDKYITPDMDLNQYLSKIGRVIIETERYKQRKSYRRSTRRCLPLSEYVQPLADSLAKEGKSTGSARLSMMAQLYKSATFRKFLDSGATDSNGKYRSFTNEQYDELSKEIEWHNNEMSRNGYAPDWQKVPKSYIDEYTEGKRKFLEACKQRVPEPT